MKTPYIRLLDSGTDEAADLDFVTRQALGMLGMDVPIEHLDDPVEISAYSPGLLPALVVNEGVACRGVPDPFDLAREIEKRL